MEKNGTKDTNPKDACGVKKVPFSVLSPRVLAQMALGMQEGALKYGRFNWRKKKVLASVYFDATLRHLFAWYEGEDFDPETLCYEECLIEGMHNEEGAMCEARKEMAIHHITKAMTSLHVLLDAILLGLLIDDRPPRGEQVSFMNEMNKMAVALTAKYPKPKLPFTHIPLPQ